MQCVIRRAVIDLQHILNDVERLMRSVFPRYAQEVITQRKCDEAAETILADLVCIV